MCSENHIRCNAQDAIDHFQPFAHISVSPEGTPQLPKTLMPSFAPVDYFAAFLQTAVQVT